MYFGTALASSLGVDLVGEGLVCFVSCYVVKQGVKPDW